VGSDYRDFHDLLDEPWTPVAPLDPALVARQVTAAGLTVEGGEEAELVLTFGDVGVLGWYLRQVTWAVPTVDVERDPGRLRAAHERILADGPSAHARSSFGCARSSGERRVGSMRRWIHWNVIPGPSEMSGS